MACRTLHILGVLAVIAFMPGLVACGANSPAPANHGPVPINVDRAEPAAQSGGAHQPVQEAQSKVDRATQPEAQDLIKKALAFRRSGETEPEVRKLGTFEVETGNVVISDPWYDAPDSAQEELSVNGLLENVRTGTWTAEVVRVDAGPNMGVRCAELRAFHNGHADRDHNTWKSQEFLVGVDSGLAGIFDRKHFGNDTSIPADYKWRADPIRRDKLWYSLCCDQTNSEFGGGVIPGGAVSLSGFGDGGYTCSVVEDEGQIAAIKIVYIAEEEEP
jgi:hypothetical protein